MDKGFNYEKKKKLAEKISKIKKKDDLIKIFEIVYEENKHISENNNGLFMFFHNLSDKTYQTIEQYLKNLKKRRCDEAKIERDNCVEKKEYNSYTTITKDESPVRENLSPQLKYSNKEKNIIKRKKYDETLISDSATCEKEKYDKNDSSEDKNVKIKIT